VAGGLLWEQPPQAGQVIERFAFSPGGHFLACVHADRTVTLYETVSGGLRGRLGKADRTRRRVYLAYDYYGRSRLSAGTRLVSPVALAFSPDGRLLATAKDTPAIHLWDLLEGREVGQLEGHEGGVASLLFSRDAEHLFSGGTDTTALTWDLTRLTRRGQSRAARLPAQAVEALWSDLASEDAARAFAAVRKLCASPDQAVALLGKRVRPTTPVDSGRLAEIVADLQSDRFERRRLAESELRGLGELAEPLLRRALADDPPLHLRQRLERLLKRSRRTPSAERLRELRAVEVLELIGSAEARQVLQALARGAPGARLTRLAKQAVRP
jgi:hypothetical protein